MKLKRVTGPAQHTLDVVTSTLGWVACAALYAIILIVIINVVGRYFFNQPILGTVEIVELVIVIFAFLAVPPGP